MTRFGIWYDYNLWINTLGNRKILLNVPDVLYSRWVIPGQLVTSNARLANNTVPSCDDMKQTSDVTCVLSLKLARNLLPRLPKHIWP